MEGTPWPSTNQADLQEDNGLTSLAVTQESFPVLAGGVGETVLPEGQVSWRQSLSILLA